jgi:hypothetical protein
MDVLITKNKQTTHVVRLSTTAFMGGARLFMLMMFKRKIPQYAMPCVIE